MHFDKSKEQGDIPLIRDYMLFSQKSLQERLNDSFFFKALANIALNIYNVNICENENIHSQYAK